MAFSFQEHTSVSSGTGRTYTYSFDAVTHDTSNIKVTIGGKHLYDGVTEYDTSTRLPSDSGSLQSAEYTLTGDSTGGTITINSDVTISGVVSNGVPTLSANQILRIFRQTNRLTAEVSFSSDSVLTDTDLNKSNNQARFLSLEAVDRADESISIDTNNTARYNAQIDGNDKRIFGVAEPVDDNDAVNRGFITTNLTKITEVEAIKTEITEVANLENGTTATNAITNVAGKTAEIQRLGTTDAVADMALLGTTQHADSSSGTLQFLGTSQHAHPSTGTLYILGTSAVVEDMGHLGTSANVTAMGHLGTSANVTNMATLTTGDNLTNIETCADNIGSLNTLATNAEDTSLALSIALG